MLLIFHCCTTTPMNVIADEIICSNSSAESHLFYLNEVLLISKSCFAIIFQMGEIVVPFNLIAFYKITTSRSVQVFQEASRCFYGAEGTHVVRDVRACEYDIWVLLNIPYCCILEQIFC